MKHQRPRRTEKLSSHYTMNTQLVLCKLRMEHHKIVWMNIGQQVIQMTIRFIMTLTTGQENIPLLIKLY